MTDIVERLRNYLTPRLAEDDEALHDEAAAEIERLRENEHLASGVADLAMKHRDVAEAEVERLRGLLVQAVKVMPICMTREMIEDAIKSQWLKL